MYPEAPLTRLSLISGYLTWFFALDDRLDLQASTNSGASWLEGICLILQKGPGSGEIPPTGEALGDAFSDLFQRTRRFASPRWLTRFSTHLQDTFQAFGAEAVHRATGIPPGRNEYIQQRRRTSCAWIFADFTELALGIELPPDLYASREYRDLIVCAADIAAWDNDLVSLRREVNHGEVNNLALVLAHAHGVPLDQAVHQVAAHINLRVADYAAAELHVLALLDATGQGDSEGARHRRLVLAQRDTLSGVVTWTHSGTDRFATPLPGDPARTLQPPSSPALRHLPTDTAGVRTP
jgi:hypothetical protein